MRRLTLANGMKVVLLPDRTVPVVTLALVFPVGFRLEQRGRTGFAHLFEHLMFDGSKHVGPGEFDRLLEAQGAVNNASTHADFTFYYETLPSHALPLAVWLEADRLSALNISPEGLRNQVDVVKEEKKRNVLNEPYGPLIWNEIPAKAFSNWANAHDAYGDFNELEAATLEDTAAFFAAHYSPVQGTAVVAGDFDPEEARELLETYLGGIPNRGGPPEAPDVSEPAQGGERSFTVEDAHARVPGAAFIWRTAPRRGSAESRALTLLGKLLFEGKSSRLYQLLVKERRLALDIQGGGGLGFPVSHWTEFRPPGLFGGFLLLKDGADPREVRRRVYEEVERLAREGPSAEELARLKTRFRSDWIDDRQTTLGRAAAVARAAVLDGDPAADLGELDRFLGASAEEIRAAAASLRPEDANVFHLKPRG